MTEIKEMEAYIKEHWFPNHKAKLTEYEDVSILDWKEEGTSIYAVRYIFAGANLYITGDIGEAIFNLTWKATPKSFQDVELGYLLGKLSCHSRDRWHYDEERAQNELKEWYEEATYDSDNQDLIETQTVYADLKEIIRNVSTPEELERELFNYYMDNSFDYHDGEDFSIFSKFGRKLPHVFVAYLLGIKMANEQIKVSEVRV